MLNEYNLNIAQVTAYMVAVQKLSLHVYGTPPKWMDEEFNKKLVEIKSDVQVWLDGILPRFTSVPRTIVDYDTYYSLQSGMIMNYLDALLNPAPPFPSVRPVDPEEVRQQLIKCIANLKIFIGGPEPGSGQEDTSIRKIVEEFRTDLKKYVSKINEAAEFFDQARDNANTEKGIDKAARDHCNDLIAELNSELKKAQDAQLGTGIAGGTALTVVAISLAFNVFFGIFAAIASLALLTATIVESVKISKLYDEIAAATLKLDDLNRTIQSLDVFVEAIDSVSAAASSALTSLGWIDGLWANLYYQIESIIETLSSDDQLARERMYKELKDSMVFTDKKWNDLVETARLYSSVTITIQDDPIPVGG